MYLVFVVEKNRLPCWYSFIKEFVQPKCIPQKKINSRTCVHMHYRKPTTDHTRNRTTHFNWATVDESREYRSMISCRFLTIMCTLLCIKFMSTKEWQTLILQNAIKNLKQQKGCNLFWSDPWLNNHRSACTVLGKMNSLLRPLTLFTMSWRCKIGRMLKNIKLSMDVCIQCSIL